MMLLVIQEQDQGDSYNCATICRNLHFITFHTPFFLAMLLQKKTCQLCSVTGMAKLSNLSFLL